VIEMAWEDRTTFDAILLNLIKRAGSHRPDAQRNETKSFIMWQKVQATQNKTLDFKEGRFKCSRQRQINNNKISKKINQKFSK
jgi:hypothetical protein